MSSKLFLNHIIVANLSIHTNSFDHLCILGFTDGSTTSVAAVVGCTSHCFHNH